MKWSLSLVAFYALAALVACEAKTQSVATHSELWQQGQVIFDMNCKSCHSMEDEKLTGPSLHRFRITMDGTEARQSIIEPSRDIVPGYTDIMPQDFGTRLTESQMDALIFYLTNG
ncbi:c-type cytochrome [Leptonema illini]|uniref:Cytochrome c domain-containing protein n=1 Tax=Leptonema illini DSM 21528 TaxID=929563 RepID=H2CE98_9LEPT|nr:cytochrome c [Leptonema illini]EHQ07653.1 hypothetical protein Lepil_2988 [Leptonema illini DSM 21528]